MSGSEKDTNDLVKEVDDLEGNKDRLKQELETLQKEKLENRVSRKQINAVLDILEKMEEDCKKIEYLQKQVGSKKTSNAQPNANQKDGSNSIDKNNSNGDCVSNDSVIPDVLQDTGNKAKKEQKTDKSENNFQKDSKTDGKHIEQDLEDTTQDESNSMHKNNSNDDGVSTKIEQKTDKSENNNSQKDSKTDIKINSEHIEQDLEDASKDESLAFGVPQDKEKPKCAKEQKSSENTLSQPTEGSQNNNSLTELHIKDDLKSQEKNNVIAGTHTTEIPSQRTDKSNSTTEVKDASQGRGNNQAPASIGNTTCKFGTCPQTCSNEEAKNKGINIANAKSNSSEERQKDKTGDQENKVQQLDNNSYECGNSPHANENNIQSEGQSNSTENKSYRIEEGKLTSTKEVSNFSNGKKSDISHGEGNNNNVKCGLNDTKNNGKNKPSAQTEDNVREVKTNNFQKHYQDEQLYDAYVNVKDQRKMFEQKDQDTNAKSKEAKNSKQTLKNKQQNKDDDENQKDDKQPEESVKNIEERKQQFDNAINIKLKRTESDKYKKDVEMTTRREEEQQLLNQQLKKEYDKYKTEKLDTDDSVDSVGKHCDILEKFTLEKSIKNIEDTKQQFDNGINIKLRRTESDKYKKDVEMTTRREKEQQLLNQQLKKEYDKYKTKKLDTDDNVDSVGKHSDILEELTLKESVKNIEETKQQFDNGINIKLKPTESDTYKKDIEMTMRREEEQQLLNQQLKKEYDKDMTKKGVPTVVGYKKELGS